MRVEDDADEVMVHEEEDPEDQDDDLAEADLGPPAGSRTRLKPTEDQLQNWLHHIKRTSDFQPDEWKVIGSLPDVKKYTTHPEAAWFAPQEVDPEAPALKYNNQKEEEKKLKTVQSHIGAVAHMVCVQLSEMSEEKATCDELRAKYENPAEIIDDPRKDMAQVLEAIKGDLSKLKLIM